MRTRSLALVVAAACSSGTKPTTTPSPTPPPAGSDAPAPARQPHDSKMEWAPHQMTLAESGIVPAWLDRTADPCTDFFAYACGGFTKTATIPDDRSSWGSIEMVQRDAEEFLKKVLEDAAAKPSGDPGV